MGINENQKLNSDRIQANLGFCLQKPYVEKAICKYMNTVQKISPIEKITELE